MSKIRAKNITLGDNVDTTKNMVIKVPTVADGTLTIQTEAGVDLITINGSTGVVTYPAAPVKVSGCMGRLAANSMTTSVWDAVNFNNIIWQVGTAFNATTYSFTAPRTGQYHISAALYITGTAITQGLIEIYNNGSPTIGFGSGGWTSTSAYPSFSRTVELTAGDVLTVYGYAQGSSLNSQAQDNGTFFSVYEL